MLLSDDDIHVNPVTIASLPLIIPITVVSSVSLLGNDPPES